MYNSVNTIKTELISVQTEPNQFYFGLNKKTKLTTNFGDTQTELN